ncbi:MAG TPA: acyl carrier protein [Pirellulales bacterium]|nr:acyl carrier protein [Pirellulales bacterium]
MSVSIPAVAPELLEQIRQIVAQVVAVEPDEVGPSTRFFADLGGESIDFLDLSFRCEKQFGIRLRFEDLLEKDHNATDESGILTTESMTLLRERFPFLDFGRLPAQPTRANLTDLLTTEAIAQFVAAALAERNVKPESLRSTHYE